MVLDPDDHPLPLEDYVRLAEGGQNSPDLFADAARLYVPPPPPRAVVLGGEPTEAAEVIARKLKGLAFTIWRDAVPLEGGDRSTMLARLAHLCFDDGLSAEEAYVIIDDVDARCGKFVNRKDRDDQLLKLIERAYE